MWIFKILFGLLDLIVTLQWRYYDWLFAKYDWIRLEPHHGGPCGVKRTLAELIGIPVLFLLSLLPSALLIGITIPYGRLVGSDTIAAMLGLALICLFGGLVWLKNIKRKGLKEKFDDKLAYWAGVGYLVLTVLSTIIKLIYDHYF